MYTLDRSLGWQSNVGARLGVFKDGLGSSKRDIAGTVEANIQPDQGTPRLVRPSTPETSNAICSGAREEAGLAPPSISY